MTLAEQKKYLLKEIDKALKTAPTEAESTSTTTGRNFGSERYPGMHTSIDDCVTIRIPGTTATYRIYNTQEALKAFATQARKGLNKQWYKPVGTRPSIKATTPRAKPLDNVSEGIYRGTPYHTDGYVCLLTAPLLKPKSYIERDNNGIENFLDRSLYDVGEKVEGIEFVADAGDTQGISDTPTTLTNSVRLVSTDITAYIPQSNFLYIMVHYPNAEFRIIPRHAIVHDGGKPIGTAGRMRPVVEERLDKVTLNEEQTDVR